VIHNLRRIASCPLVTDIIVATRGDVLESLQASIRAEKFAQPVRVVRGGDSRQESVAQALREVPADAEIVLVHDAARPFVTAVLSILLALCGYLAAGCGSRGMSSGTVPPPPTPSSVTMVVSSTANDQFASFYVDVSSISLTNQAGTAVNVLAAPQPKFKRLNLFI
jgi:hypothetical protein